MCRTEDSRGFDNGLVGTKHASQPPPPQKSWVGGTGAGTNDPDAVVGRVSLRDALRGQTGRGSTVTNQRPGFGILNVAGSRAPRK